MLSQNTEFFEVGQWNMVYLVDPLELPVLLVFLYLPTVPPEPPLLLIILLDDLGSYPPQHLILPLRFPLFLLLLLPPTLIPTHPSNLILKHLQLHLQKLQISVDLGQTLPGPGPLLTQFDFSVVETGGGA